MEQAAVPVTYAMIGSVVMATLCAIAAKYLVPRWLEDLRAFRDNTMAQMTALREELGRIREAYMVADTSLKLDMMTRETAIRDLQHGDVQRMNVEIGKVANQGAENKGRIDRLHDRLDTMEKRADDRHEEQVKSYHNMDKKLDKIGTAVENLAEKVDESRAETKNSKKEKPQTLGTRACRRSKG